MIESMFHLQLPVLEKIARPMIMYLCLILLLRLFGKRELAQLNPFDLVVLLSLTITVQNAMIGNDTSVTGGLLGAIGLLSANWLMMRFLYNAPRVNAALEGTATVLIEDGVVDRGAMKRETMTEMELMSVLHKQGLDSPAEVKRCVLEPNGTFYVEGVSPSGEARERTEMLETLRALRLEVGELRARMVARGLIGA